MGQAYRRRFGNGSTVESEGRPISNEIANQNRRDKAGNRRHLDGIRDGNAWLNDDNPPGRIRSLPIEPMPFNPRNMPLSADTTLSNSSFRAMTNRLKGGTYEEMMNIYSWEDTFLHDTQQAHIRCATRAFMGDKKNTRRDVTEKELKGELVAVKVIRKKAFEVGALDEIRKEAWILSELHNVHIVSFLGFYEDDLCFYLVMEHIAYGDLFDTLKSVGKLTEYHVREIAYQLFDALKHCYQHHIIHGDIKLENILVRKKEARKKRKLIYKDSARNEHFAVDDNGKSVTLDTVNAADIDNNAQDFDILLCDFGMARHFVSQERREQFLDYCKQGTAAYIAPEVWRSNECDYKIDVWATGVVLHILLSGGYYPFGYNISMLTCDINKLDDQQIENLILTREAVPLPRNAWKAVSLEGRKFVELCLKKDPRKRMGYDEVFLHSWFNLEDLDHVFNPLNTIRYPNIETSLAVDTVKAASSYHEACLNFSRRIKNDALTAPGDRANVNNQHIMSYSETLRDVSQFKEPFEGDNNFS